MAPPAPTIEGTLKSTIHCFGFGLIVAVLSVNLGKLFLNNYFVYIVAVVVTVEAILFSLYRPRRDYELYRPPGRRGTHCIGGEMQINVQEPGEESTTPSPRKRKLPLMKGREKDRLMKKEMKDHQKRMESSLEVSPAARPDTLQVPGMGQPITRSESFGKGDKEQEKAEKDEERGKEKIKSGWRKKN